MKYKSSLQSKGRLLVIDSPKVMGILNITPDSFHTKSRAEGQQVVDLAGQMLLDGAHILDIGGQSTRPGAEQIGASLEADRVLPAIEAVRHAFPDCWISVDTYHATVASNAAKIGADIINDVSAGDDDPEMLPLVAKLKVPYIAMHKQGSPEKMQQNPQYENVVTELVGYFADKKSQLDNLGIYDWVLDLGFGFGKTMDHNFLLLKNVKSFVIFDKPILVGISRKGMIQKTLNVSADGALNGTTALNMFALSQGASILRVHDVKEAIECFELWKCISKEGESY